jgi:hydroxypyruvate reductase
VAAPAQVRALILSDVIHNDLAVIASGPLVPDPTTFADALRVLVDRDVIHRVPPSVRERLTLGVRGDLPETPKPGDPIFTGLECVLVGSNSQSRQAARTRAGALGYTSSGRPAPITGEAREGAATLARAARAILSSGAPGRFVLVTGGETTVTVRGKGRGGRSQEMALALALALEDLSAPRSTWAFLAAGTDGIDGPTDAAGGIVDGGTIGRIRSAGMDPHAALKDNDSHAALAAAGDLVKTGPTGTNVADLQVLLVVTGPRDE